MKNLIYCSITEGDSTPRETPAVRCYSLNSFIEYVQSVHPLEHVYVSFATVEDGVYFFALVSVGGVEYNYHITLS